LTEHFDVVVVGAGLSGIGAGYRLQTECPRKSYVILEARDALGGTWDLFRYPGVRSDSDMHTLSFPFRPWRGKRSMVDGPSILAYLRETAEEHGIDRRIRFGQRVVRASWSSEEARWTLDVRAGDDAAPTRYTAGFLYLCSGYYSYEHGYQPEFPGVGRFDGPVIHPQSWPDDLDHAGKRIVVIGSGATAVTLVPALAERAAHVTMLQRSPSYVLSLPGEDPLSAALWRHLPERVAGPVVRWINALGAAALYQVCRRAPSLAKKMLRSGVRRLLPADYQIDPHFSPTYDPWDQRLCLVPDGDLFVALGSGRASIVTDRITTFTEHGISLESGAELDADVVVTATGLEMLAWGGIEVDVDGIAQEPGKAYFFRGFMMSDIPNLAMCLGYTNASWTLRADLVSRSVCRLLNHMDRHGYASAVPVGDPSLTGRSSFPLSAGYVQRALDRFPKQGTRSPWYLRQNYVIDAFTTRFGDLTRGLSFTRRRAGAPEADRSLRTTA
jgi:cation diffusion facilitator CzcD-associated flavoprotein CzcO